MNYNAGGGRQRTYLMLAMKTLMKEDWSVAFSPVLFLLVLHWYSLFPARPVLPLFSFAFICSGRGSATEDEDDANGDMMLLAEQTLPLFLLIFSCSGHSFFLVSGVGFVTLVTYFESPVFVSVLSLLRR